MTTEIGCFGSVLYHDAESRRCSVCPMLEACKVTTAENKTKLDAWYDTLVTSKSKAARNAAATGFAPVATTTRTPSVAARTVSEPLVNAEGTATTTLNKKPREFVERWMQKGIKFQDYKNGVNPFEYSGNKFAAVAMQFFMDNPGGVTKMELVDELIAKCGTRGQGWGSGTACSHANIVLEAFGYLGITIDTGGKTYLR